MQRRCDKRTGSAKRAGDERWLLLVPRHILRQRVRLGHIHTAASVARAQALTLPREAKHGAALHVLDGELGFMSGIPHTRGITGVPNAARGQLNAAARKHGSRVVVVAKRREVLLETHVAVDGVGVRGGCVVGGMW